MCRKALHPFGCLILIQIAMILLTGCGSSTDVNPLEPTTVSTRNLPATSVYELQQSNRYLWGFWNVRIALDTLEVEVIPDRSAAMHFNVLRKLEVSPCSSCLRLEHLRLYPPGYLQADLILRHPFTIGPKLTGFDVRAIFLTGADHNFPASGRSVGFGDGIPRMVNCDGYTTLFNPTDFPSDLPVPYVLKYFPGRYAFGGDLSATLNPYLAYGQESPRRMFSPYDLERRTVIIDLPEGPFEEIEFGYAVDACWAPVDGEVSDPVTDFPPDANCLEAYQVSVVFYGELSQYTWSRSRVCVEVYDHQGLSTVSSVSIEAPDLFTGELPLQFVEKIDDGAGVFAGYVYSELGALPGVYPLLVRVVDTETDANLGPISAWNLRSIVVKRGWAQTWGGSLIDEGLSVAVDSSGNVFVTGQFQDVVDFDPSHSIWTLSTNGGYDVYLNKFDSNGGFEWALAWGGNGADCGNCVAVDSMGNAYVSGRFAQTVDFDPGSGEYWVTSNGYSDAFLCKFDSSGNLLWAKTWGGEGADECCGLAIDGLDHVFICGRFAQIVDFDPGPALDEHQSNGNRDVFLSMFESDGDFIWARTWGGVDYDESLGVAADSGGNAYVTGDFHYTVDFDPGSGVVEYTAHGKDLDSFLSKFDSNGELLWARAWGGEFWEGGSAIALDSESNAFVTGPFFGLVDFDPGPGVDEYDSDHESASFLSKFSADGNYQWVRIWRYDIRTRGLSTGADGKVFLAGSFSHSNLGRPTDFDPGPDTDFRTCSGMEDAFLLSLGIDGAYEWTQTWGGRSNDQCRGMGVTILDEAFVIGWFRGAYYGIVDFDPGDGVEEHTSNGESDVFLSMFPPDGEW